MKLPSHTTVIAYLALFVALGGSAYAAIQLPKNSVGTKQLKPNAVTAAKIKKGVVTGAKIAPNTVTGVNVDESSLGRVPSAASAETASTAGHAATAANATNAANAKALGGVPSSGFLQTDAVQFHTGPLNACFAQVLAEIPGWFRIETVGNCQNEFNFRIMNLSSEAWSFISKDMAVTIGADGDGELSPAGNSVNLFAIAQLNPDRHALVDCVYQPFTTPARISCSTRVPPAA